MNDERMAMEFDAWWKEFSGGSREPRDPEASGPEAGLSGVVAALREPQRHAFLGRLVDLVIRRDPGWEVAAAALERHHDADALARLAEHAERLRNSPDVEDQSAVCECMKTLARSGAPEHRGSLERFLLAEPIGPFWGSVPWSLWPQDPDLFGRSWARYFSDQPEPRWRDNAVSQAFLKHADALARVRDVMLVTRPGHWPALRDAILGQAGALWVTDEDRARLNEVCAR